LRLTHVLILSVAAAACGGSPSSPSTTTAGLSSVTLASTSVSGGNAITATVTLTAGAPADGAVVTLSSSSTSLAAVPASITVASGSTTAAFDVQTGTTSVTGVAIITATYAGVARTAALTVGRLTLQSLTLSSASAIGGSAVTGTIAVSAPAPDGGLDVALASSSAAAIVPAHTTIPAGESLQTFTIATRDTASPVVATITATIPFTGSSRDASLTISRLGVQQVSLGLTSVPAGVPLTGTVLLTAPAPVDAVVVLSSTDSIATVPASVTIPAGMTSQPFDITTVNAPPTRTATITAAYGGTTQSASLTVIAYPTIPSLSCTSTTPKGGTISTCTGTLSSPAPPGGWQLQFVTSDDTLATAAPDSLTVPAAGLTFQFDVLTAPVTTSTGVVIRIFDAPSGLPRFSQAFTITP
jgi:trimeric autotransporter adhesin